MKIYIAAKFEDVDLYKELQTKLENNKHEITCDWTEHKKVHPFSKHKHLCYMQSIDDIMGIKEADVVILIYNGKKGSGMSFEIGYATALNKKVLMYCPRNENINFNSVSSEDYSMFVHLNNFIHIKNTTHLFDVLKEIEFRKTNKENI